MRPAIAFPGKHEPPDRGPQELILRAHFAEDAALPLARLPHFTPLAGCRVRHANRPGLVGAPGAVDALAAVAGFADERDRAAIRRPFGLAIQVGAGIEIAQRIRADVIDADKSMVAAIADKAEPRAVGRPHRPLI